MQDGDRRSSGDQTVLATGESSYQQMTWSVMYAEGREQEEERKRGTNAWGGGGGGGGGGEIEASEPQQQGAVKCGKYYTEKRREGSPSYMQASGKLLALVGALYILPITACT